MCTAFLINGGKCRCVPVEVLIGINSVKHLGQGLLLERICRNYVVEK